MKMSTKKAAYALRVKGFDVLSVSEAESRIDAYNSGKLTSIPINDVFNDIK